jgi:hypothetical protein
MITVDAAGDEVLAGEMMRKVMPSMIENITPNLQCVIRDKAHGSRRLMSRPWHADKMLNSVLRHFALSKTSPAQMIQHSPDLRAELKRICRMRMPSNSREQGNLRAAKHRFESFQKPLGRTIRLYDCIHELMVNLAQTRNDMQVFAI